MAPNHYLSQWWLVISEILWPWWCHDMEMFSTLLALCEGNPPVTGHQWDSVAMMISWHGNVFYITGPLWGESTCDRSSVRFCGHDDIMTWKCFLHYWPFVRGIHLWQVISEILWPWWCHDMEMFSTLLTICEGNPPVTGGFPSQRASNVDNVFFVVSDVIIGGMASRLCTQQFVQMQIKENIKAPRHWPLWGEFTSDRWISCTKGQ